MRTSTGATIVLGFFALMCGKKPAARIKIQPLEKSAAGTTSGSAAASGRGSTGKSGGAGGTTNGAVGPNGSTGAGEGGAREVTDDDGGEVGRAGTSNVGGSGDSDGSGGTGARDGSGGSGALDGSGGTSGEDATSGTGGSSDAGLGNEAGSDSGATGGTSGHGGLGGSGATAGGGVGGVAGAAGSCGTKTACCAPDDPPCVDGCPSNATFCCNLNLGARMKCDPAAEYASVVCLNTCDGQSFGTQGCSTTCVQPNDPPCSDPTWVDVCVAGGFGYCSDPAAGYRAGCYSADGALFYSYVSCTCDPDF